MWDKRQVLVELKAYITRPDGDDTKTDIVSSYITRSLVKEKKYQASLKSEKTDEIEEINGKDESTELNTDNKDQDRLIKDLENVNLNGDSPSLDPDQSDVTQSLSNCTIDEGNQETELSMMEALGLPTNFGPKRGKSRKEQRLTEKQIRGKFSSIWEDEGELLVYKAFASVYPDYACYYDQITGSIPASQEVCVESTNSPDCEDCATSGNTSKDLNSEDADESLNSFNLYSADLDNVCEKSALKNDGSQVVNSVENENVSVCSVNEGGDKGDQCEKTSESSQDISIVNISSKGDMPESSRTISDHGYSSNTDHSYGVSDSVADKSKGQMKDECCEDVGNDPDCEYQYTHEELIALLRDTQQDLENQIYWHAKETISEWFRNNPSKDFDISSLDDDIIAITYPYMQEQEEVDGEEQGEGENGEYEDEYGYYEEKDEDLLDENGWEKPVNVIETLELCGLAVEKDPEACNRRKRKYVHGTLLYKRKNLISEASRMQLDFVAKKSKHIVFDDQGNACEDVSDNHSSHNFSRKFTDYEDIGSKMEKSEELKPDKEDTITSDTSVSEIQPFKKPTHKVFDDDDFDYSVLNLVQKEEQGSDSDDSGPEERPISRKLNPSITRSKSLSSLVSKEAEPLPLATASLSNSVACLAEAKTKLGSRKILEVKTENGVTSILAKSNLKSKKKCKTKTKKQSEKCPDDIEPEVGKYWYQRYQLFSRFDHGIKLDKESWYSVTPEAIAAHHARRCRGRRLLDGFCGAGGNAVQFALLGCQVTAVDIDEEKIALARHNAAIYGVEKKITFIVGDFYEVAPRLAGEVDLVFLGPPWGGPGYSSHTLYDVEDMQASKLMETSRKVTQNIAIYAPKNSCATQLLGLAGPDARVEIEQNFLDHRLKAITAYFGDLAMPDPDIDF